jgi:EmrB/QacA subfamily drug resistance transporter
VASAAGPLLGGYLISAASWRWIFLINVPVGALVLFLTARHVPESRDPGATGGIDLWGALLAVLALAGLSGGLIEGSAQGWTAPVPVIALTGGTLAAIVFVVVESRLAAPMLPLSLFRRRQFTVTNAVTFVLYAALGGALFLLPVTLQVVDGYSPLEAGLALLPLTLVMLVLSSPSGQLASRIGPRLQMSVGPMVVGVGFILLWRAPADHSYVTGILPAVFVFALGLAITVAPLTATALGAVPEDHAGMASAINNVVARIGGLIAVAVLPAIAGIDNQAYLHPSALAHGFRIAAVVAGVWCIAAGLVAAVGIRNHAAPATGGDSRSLVEPCGPVHCGLDAPPLTVGASDTGSRARS